MHTFALNMAVIDMPRLDIVATAKEEGVTTRVKLLAEWEKIAANISLICYILQCYTFLRKLFYVIMFSRIVSKFKF